MLKIMPAYSLRVPTFKSVLHVDMSLDNDSGGYNLITFKIITIYVPFSLGGCYEFPFSKLQIVAA